MHPRVINFSRPQYVRDLMVANGDASKPIWISEMGWNAVPDEVEDKRFGQVSPEDQGRYAALAYQRAAQEWPWMGVINTWYLKRATDEWERERRPEAYFKLVNPDFTTQPAYETLKTTLSSLTPVFYPGYHAPDGWAAKREGEWQALPDPDAPYGAVYRAGPGARLSFTFDGTDVLATTRCAAGPCNARLLVRIDGEEPGPVSAAAEPEKESRLPLAQGLSDGPHGVSVEVREGIVDFHALVVERHTFPIRLTR
jgi:hypothetical protein